MEAAQLLKGVLVKEGSSEDNVVIVECPAGKDVAARTTSFIEHCSLFVALCSDSNQNFNDLKEANRLGKQIFYINMLSVEEDEEDGTKKKKKRKNRNARKRNVSERAEEDEEETKTKRTKEGNALKRIVPLKQMHATWEPTPAPSHLNMNAPSLTLNWTSPPPEMVKKLVMIARVRNELMHLVHGCDSRLSLFSFSRRFSMTWCGIARNSSGHLTIPLRPCITSGLKIN